MPSSLIDTLCQHPEVRDALDRLIMRGRVPGDEARESDLFPGTSIPSTREVEESLVSALLAALPGGREEAYLMAAKIDGCGKDITGEVTPCDLCRETVDAIAPLLLAPVLRDNESLRKERDEQERHEAEMTQTCAHLLARAEASEAQLAAVREALTKYGMHKRTCGRHFLNLPATMGPSDEDRTPTCTCGLDAALAGDTV